MAKKSRKRVTRRPAKKSWLEKLFTFPKLAVYFFVALSVFTIYQVVLPGTQVKGVTSVAPDDDMVIISESEAKAILAQGNSSPYVVHQVDVFIDNDKTNGKLDKFKEHCFESDVRLYADNGNRVRTFDPVSGCSDPIRIRTRTKTKTIIIGIKPITNYKNTGLTYTDKYYTNRTIRNVSKVKVTGFASGYPQTGYFTNIQFGIKRK